MKFKPEDIHCKPIISDLDKSPGILLKLNVKQASGNEGMKEPDIDYNVVGITALNYSFNSKSNTCQDEKFVMMKFGINPLACF